MRQFIKIVESATEIEGLPAHVEVSDPEITRLLGSPRYRLVARPDGDDYIVTVMPRETEGMTAHDTPAYRGTVRLHYDATKSKLVPYDDDPEIAMGRVKPKLDPGFTREITALEGNFMYRGISAEEWHHIKLTGEVISNGSGNLGPDQVGLTYWSTEIDSAQYYAHAFAGMLDKAAPGFPAYVIAAPLAKNVKHVEGTAAHEIGIMGSVSIDELVAVWEGKVWSFRPTDTLLRQHWDSTWKGGGVSHPSAELEWKRII